jgi:hypothetical protein
MKVGGPIDLKDHAPAYDQNKRDTVQNVNPQLERDVRQNLEAMEATCAIVRET